MDTTTIIGFFAVVCTSVSYFPQLKKCWDNGKAEDLSPDVQHPGNRRRYLGALWRFQTRTRRHRCQRGELVLPGGHTLVQLREKPSTV